MRKVTVEIEKKLDSFFSKPKKVKSPVPNALKAEKLLLVYGALLRV